MAWDTEGTKRKILDAAVDEFSRHGLAGARVDRIAAQSGVNKERLYGHFGNKEKLFAVVLRAELSKAAAAVPMDVAGAADLASIAGAAFDYHEQHPQLARLLHWEALAYGVGAVPDEQARGSFYQDKVTAFRAGQGDGLLTPEPDADLLVFMVLALAAWWFAVPQVARMITGVSDPHTDRERRRAAVVEAAGRIAIAPAQKPEDES